MEQLALFETETPDAISGVCLDPGAPYRAPAALTDQECEIREIRPQAASELVRAWHSILPHIPPVQHLAQPARGLFRTGHKRLGACRRYLHLAGVSLPE